MAQPFSLNARMAVFSAREEARSRAQAAVDTEHLLLGLLAETDGVAAYLLRRLEIDAASLRRILIEQMPPIEPDSAPAEPVLTDRARLVTEVATEEAHGLYSCYTGTEHLLLGVMREVTGLAGRLLRDVGLFEDQFRQEIRAFQEEPTPCALTDAGNPGDTPMVKMAQGIIRAAIEAGAERIHIAPDGGEVKVLTETDGTWTEATTVPRHFAGPLQSAFKEMIEHYASEHDRAARCVPVVLEGRRADLVLTPDGADAGAGLLMSLRRRPGPEEVPEGEGTLLPPLRGGRSQRMAPPPGPSPIADVLTQHALRGRDILGIEDMTAEEIRLVLDVATRLRANKFDATQTQFAQGQTLAMLFEKPSLRTRVTFEAGMTQLGGHAIYLEGRLGVRETVPDVARNLERWLDGIMARTFAHQTVVELAEYASIPVINGLSDREHPCQAFADFQTLLERKGRLDGLTMAFVGDGNNVAHSLMLLAAKIGTHFTLACPPGYEPFPDIWAAAQEAAAKTGAVIRMTHDPVEGVTGADAVYTDVWASMGQEEEAAARAAIFAPFQVNAALMAHARPDALVMHCLPAHRGEEITADVLDSPHSVVFDQAENRLHAQKALLALVL